MVKINSYYDHNKFFNLLNFKIHYKKEVERKVLVVFFKKILHTLSHLIFSTFLLILCFCFPIKFDKKKFNYYCFYFVNFFKLIYFPVLSFNIKFVGN